MANARDVRERLKPLRQVLDDFDAAVILSEQLAEDDRTRNARIQAAKVELLDLDRQREAAQELFQAEQAERTRQAAEWIRAENDARQTHEASMAAMAADQKRAEALWAERRATLEHEYASDRDRLRGEIDALQARRDELRAETSAIEARLVPLLGR